MAIDTQELDVEATNLVVDYLQCVMKDYRDRAMKRSGSIVLAPEDQHAIRIFESRIRRLHNTADVRYGENEQIRLRAALALQLNDNGDLIQFAEINHSRGRLDCAGCDFLYVGMNKEPQCVLCPYCQLGVLHVRTVHGPHVYDDKLLGTINLTAHEIVRWAQCDECGSRSIVPVREDA